MAIKLATLSELDELSALCYQSKACWGYDDSFMESCREELTFRANDLSGGSVVFYWLEKGKPCGVAQLIFGEQVVSLEKLFVAPLFIGSGVGRTLFEHAILLSRGRGMSEMRIEADPFAEGFYGAMGARRQGEVASKTMVNRWLPLLIYRLDRAVGV